MRPWSSGALCSGTVVPTHPVGGHGVGLTASARAALQPFTIGLIFMILFLSSRSDWHPPRSEGIATRERTLDAHRENVKEMVSFLSRVGRLAGIAGYSLGNKLLEDKTLLEKKVSHALERHPELAEDFEAIAAAHAAALAQNKRRKNETTVVNSDESDTSDTNREGNTNTKGQDSFRDAGETDKTVGVRGFTPEYPLHANGEGVAILPNQGGPGGSQEPCICLVPARRHGAAATTTGKTPTSRTT
eukprot:scaffold49_cov409-Prasinococcus_capsulatus_cf.AAC.23